ncbi:sulfotransferase family protein [Yinghuangia seranimata]|uniref:sulfotransferase family protein n=1 Tax=Yinghuangia seranimata TaxID=408067 RepID=UPI00248BCC71|nr:sulfotransferase [Yinghuangia seranimata]MDI2130648.1 sulfotransferase [Yinghuangia seranimata]
MTRTEEPLGRLLDQVAAETGLDDFGDPSFRTGLDRIAAAVDETADLTPIGRMVFEGQTKAALTARAKVADWERRHPGLADEPVTAPVFVIGLPRSGTTALSHLLAADPANRSLLGWEAQSPTPPPETATYHDDPRLHAARSAPSLVDRLNPGFKAIHHDPPEAPVECTVLLAQHFASLMLSTMYTVPEYDAWLLASDMTAAYDHHHRMLRLLQSRCPGTWYLKAPVHCHALDEVVARYPDARFVVTHRDPAVTVASTCSLVRSLSGTFTETDHSATIGRTWSGNLATMADRVLDHRARHGDGRFLDVAYADLVGDPIGTVRTVYGWLGRELDADTEAAMRAHTQENKQHKFGRHTYALDDFGLTDEWVNDRFAAYREAYGIPFERRR